MLLLPVVLKLSARESAGGVEVARGVGLERIGAAGGVGVARGVGLERLGSQRRVVVSVVG